MPQHSAGPRAGVRAVVENELADDKIVLRRCRVDDVT